LPNISVFRNVSEVENPIKWDLIQYLEDTRDGMWEDIVTQCRAISDKKERQKFKQTMPTTTLSGYFSYRSDDKLIEHSGVLAIDLDHVNNVYTVKKSFQSDKYVMSVFLSTSGDGLRVLFMIDPLFHRQAFKGIAAYIYEKYGLVADPNGINISKPYVVSFDPLAYINYGETKQWTKYPKEKPIKNINSYVHTDEDFKYVMEQILGRGINLCEDYNEWCRIGFALADKFGEEGEDYFHRLSQMSLKYNEKICHEQYKRCLRGKGTEKVQISTFYFLAKQAGVNIVSEKTKTISRVTRNGKKSGLGVDQIVKMLEKNDGITGVDDTVSEIFEQKSDYEDAEESVLHLLEMFISSNYQLRMNEVTGYLENYQKVQYESDLNTIFIAAKKVIPTLDFKLMMRLLKSDFIPQFNPFFDYLGSDGIPFPLPATPIENGDKFKSPIIDKFASCIINEDPAYTLYFTRKWLVSIISAMHKVHSPLLHCLAGKQNTGKTEFYRRLLPKKLMGYFQQSKLDKGKDDELLMCENILIMDDELSGKSKADSIKLNSITSQDYYSLRRPYGDHNEKVLRYAVLCGTTNYPQNILTDPTGNRRVIPIEVIDINKELYNSISKDDLFMEAFRLYKEGFDWRITKDDIPYLNVNSERYEVVIKERELIQKYYYPDGHFEMTTTDIMVELSQITKQNNLSLITIGRELKNLGFSKKTIRTPISELKHGDKMFQSKWAIGKCFPNAADKFSEDPPF
jgi:hypothetical protein